MLNKYNDFILEKRVIELLLEDNLMASDDFLLRLSTIKDKSKIADAIYKSFDSTLYISDNLPQNWINITDKDDYISFLSDVKADKIDDIDEESPYGVKGRGEIKIGRFARAFFTHKGIESELFNYGYLKKDYKFTDKDYEDFTNLYKASNIKSESKFELIKGDKIKYYYNEENYKYSERGQLGSSCMRYESCEDFFGIYTENPDSCQLLVLLDGEELIGRALVWKLSKGPCNATYFMDRVYTATDSDVIKFNNYCDKEGWMRKYKNNCDNLNSYFFIYKGETVFGEVAVKLKEVEFDEYPFVDTLSWLSKDNKTISNVGSSGADSMTDTDGSSSECYTCDGKGTVDDKECDYCNCNGVVDCGTCDEEGVSKKCKECGGDGEVKCEHCDEGYLNGDCPDCTGSFERDIKDIVRNGRNASLSKLAKDYWDKLKSEKKVKKKEKKDDKKKKKK
jgi:hypothetical protein